LHPGQFRCVADGGIGDGGNAYPHAMSWFGEHLYLGTTRLVLTLLYNRYPELRAWPLFPVRTAKKNPYHEFDASGQIWRYHPPTAKWELLLKAPMITGKDGQPVPLFQGVRNMLHFTRPGETKPSLYTLTWSPQTGPGPLLLRTDNGSAFEQIGMIGFAATKYSTFRPLLEFKGKLFTAPTGRTGSANTAGAAIVLESKDPLTDPWREVNEENFGDPHNETVFEMVVFNNRLYAGTMNPEGFQLWRTDAEGEPPYTWTRVLTRGAWRGANNEGVGSLCVFNGSLYVGSVISNGGYDRRHCIGPAAVEILRVHPDDSWDLVMGEPRMTPEGAKFPLSGMGPGFDKGFNAYLWRMCEHDGWLYAGTFAWSSLLLYAPRDKWPEHVKRLMDPDRTNLILDKLGGFDLWRTRDGAVWFPVTRNGFANPFNWGVRTMQSTKHGLFVGTANPFGPDIAVERAAGWKYEPNPKGGMEIWLGSDKHTGGAHTRPGLSAPPPSQSLSLGTSMDRDEAEFVEQTADAFYGGTGLRLVGWWKNKPKNAIEACHELVHELRLLAPADAAAVRVFARCPAAVRAILPETTTSQGDVVFHLEAGDLASSIAALKPGGLLVAALAEKEGEPAFALPGLSDVVIRDETASTWRFFQERLGLFLWERALDAELDQALVERVKQAIQAPLMPLRRYLIVTGRR
jgi:hypothetical protein